MKLVYPARFCKEKEGGYSVEVPDLKGCIEEIKLENKNEFVSLLLLDIDKYTEKYGSTKSVKKTLTIPTWLNHRAEKIGLNFSKTLQDALLSKIIKYQNK